MYGRDNEGDIMDKKMENQEKDKNRALWVWRQQKEVSLSFWDTVSGIHVVFFHP